MGVCSSSESTAAISIASAVAPPSTAKLVMEDGRLQEFNRPVKVSEILRRSHRAFFVCDADEMRMEGVLSALDAEAELKPGQLYFLLPLFMMRRRLRPPDMAELAVKASSALIMSASGDALPVFPAEAGVESCSRSRREVGRKKVRSGGRRVKGGASRSYFKLELSVIPEYLEEEEEDDDDEDDEEEEEEGSGLLIV